MISCRDLIELLLDFDSDGLSSERRDHVEKHLVGCPACHAYLESYRITVRLARQLPCPPLSAPLEARLQQMIASNAPGKFQAGPEAGSET